jgi:hypothetical protein
VVCELWCRVGPEMVIPYHLELVAAHTQKPNVLWHQLVVTHGWYCLVARFHKGII